MQLLYPVGKHIGIRDIKDQQTNAMKFIKQQDQIKEITCMCLSPNKKFLAVCERHKNDQNAYISFYDMRGSGYKPHKQSVNIGEMVGGFPSSVGYQTTGGKAPENNTTQIQ